MYWYLIISFIIIIYLYSKTYKKPCLSTDRKSPRTVYLFITGGFDSTFRLCQLATAKKYVQCIYLKIPDVDGINIRRQNVEYELKSINNAINELKKMGYGKYIYPVEFIERCDLSNGVKKDFDKLVKLGMFSRAVNQYTYMCEVSLQMNKIFDTGILGDPNGSLYIASKYLEPDTNLLDIDKIENENKPELLVFRNIKFSLHGFTKGSMAEYAKKNGFYHILEKTISCWYPINGKPCGKCVMCKERII